MSKKYFLLCIVIFLSSFNLAYAGLVINEIMYDLSGADSASSKSREWIEIRNPDGSDVVVDGAWRMYDGAANRTINGQVDFTIPAGAYVIFAGDKDTFLADHPGFSGVVYDTGITSLNNTGATLKILDQDENTVDQVTYASAQGAAGDGNSLQKISGSWSGAAPTPGQANESVSPPPEDDEETSEDSPPPSGGDASGGIVKPEVPVPKKIKTQIMANKLAFAGSSLSLQAVAFGHSGEKLHGGRYFLNFGDGDSKEIKNGDSHTFTHTYFYPGEYTVNLEYYLNYYGDTPEATDTFTIKVISADVVISLVGDEKDFFVELTNNTSYDADISNWTLSGNDKSFTFAKNTILGSKKKTTVSSRITNLSTADKDSLKLLTAQGMLAFEYLPTPSVVIPEVVVRQDLATKTSPNPLLTKERAEGEVDLNLQEEQIPPEDLTSSAISSGITEDSSFRKYIPSAVFAMFLGASAYAVHFIRKKKNISGVGDDFQILDE